jgi:hypothetical protein
MAFCNSCGAALNAGTNFCNKCGAAQTGAPMGAPGQPAAAVPAKQGSSALKIILIVVAVIVGLGILGIGTASYFVYRVAHNSHVTQRNGDVKIDSPFGTIESSSDPTAMAKDIGLDPYPGSEPMKNGSSSVSFGNIHTVAMQMTTDDPPSQVADYYKSKLSNISYSTGQGDNYSMMAGGKDDATTVSISVVMGKTHIVVSRVTKK